jgi:putative flippase GtrA
MSKFLSFSIIGVGGFLVDSVILLAFVRGLELGLYLSRVFSFLGAATFTWAMNRRFTFRTHGSDRLREWAKFLLANSVGGLVNYAVYATLVASSVRVASQPVLGVAAGSLAGLSVNFILSKRAVFVSR